MTCLISLIAAHDCGELDEAGLWLVVGDNLGKSGLAHARADPRGSWSRGSAGALRSRARSARAKGFAGAEAGAPDRCIRRGCAGRMRSASGAPGAECSGVLEERFWGNLRASPSKRLIAGPRDGTGNRTEHVLPLSVVVSRPLRQEKIAKDGARERFVAGDTILGEIIAGSGDV